LRRSVENPWVKYSTFEKKWQEKKREEGKVFIEPLGGVEIFRAPVENPLSVFGTGEGCFKTLKNIKKNFRQGLPKVS
jgi:hypothetical protein